MKTTTNMLLGLVMAVTTIATPLFAVCAVLFALDGDMQVNTWAALLVASASAFVIAWRLTRGYAPT
jgi:hypothetical protein